MKNFSTPTSTASTAPAPCSRASFSWIWPRSTWKARSPPPPAQRPPLLARAADNLLLAENYGAEGNDHDPAVRNALTARAQALHGTVMGWRETRAAARASAELPETIGAVRQLAKDFGATELDRWGTLSSLNTALAARMKQMHFFIAGIVLVFVLVMAALGWALARTRRAEADLQRTKAEVEAIQQTTLDTSAMGIVYVDTADLSIRRIAVANRQMAVIFGYPPDELVGASVVNLYADRATYDRFTEEMPGRLAGGEVVREEVLMRRRNGTRFWCSLSIKAIAPAVLARGVVWTCEDISERKQAEAQLELAKQHAEAASRAKSDFLANMSHELRTPFAGILGLLDLLQRTPLDATQLRYVQLARDSATQMLALVNDILDFSKIEAGKLLLDPVAFDPRHLFASLAEVHAQAAARKGLAFSLDFTEPLPAHLKGDRVRIRQIIDNLVGNAIKFTRRGAVRIGIACHLRDDRTATLQVAVTDSGIGIPAEMQEHIFEKFTQADSSTTRLFGGTGLGLAICRELATLMGGRIAVDSAAGRGSSFRLAIDLPLAAAPAGPDPVAAAGKTGRLEEAVILLVDDNELNRDIFAEVLGAFGCGVIQAENGEQAIRLAREARPDLILMDCQMPVMDGYEATRRIRADESAQDHSEQVPILALTAHATSSDRNNSLASGMDDYLTKPVLPDILRKKIVEWLGRRSGSLPSAIPDAAAPAPVRPCARRFSGRILLVEDNPAIQEATQKLIERTGCEVLVVDHGQAAIDALERAAEEGRDDFDLVLMDCRMPILDGWETVRRWRVAENRHGLAPTAIVGLTACDLADTRQRCVDAGMDDVLLKPFDEPALLALLGAWLKELAPGNQEAKARRRG